VPALAAHVAEYSSHVGGAQRAAALAGVRSGAVRVLVTSDAMARGMDVSGMRHVVNYDPPTFPKTYVHRAGRTARAGSGGACYTLCKPEDVVHFNAMLRKLQGSRVKQYKLPPAVLQAHRPALRQALAQVQALVALEQQLGGGGERAAAAAAGGQPTAELQPAEEQRQQQEQGEQQEQQQQQPPPRKKPKRHAE
jgi:ATP-dependent RNA helicase DDX51/DBP6